MKKLSLFLLAFLIIPCMCIFGACNEGDNQPPKQIAEIYVGYTGTDFANYPGTPTTPTLIEIQYGKNISVDFKDFQVILKYDDNTQSPLTSFDAIINHGVKITHNIPSTTSPTPRGDYDITFTTPNNLEYKVTCRVIHKLIDVPTAVVQTYNGEVLTPKFEFMDDDADYVELVDYDKNATNVDTYSATYELTDPENCMWFSHYGSLIGTQQTFDWSISRKAYKIPSIDDIYYTGEEQDLILIDFDTNIMTVSGTTTATTVNQTPLSAVVAFKDTTNCMWEDKTVTPKTIEWNILPQPIVRPYVDTTAPITFDTTAKKPNILSADHDNILIEDVSHTNVGEYTTNVSLIDDINYCWEDGSNDSYDLIWRIVKGELAFNIPFETTPLTAVYGTLIEDLNLTALETMYPGTWELLNYTEGTTVGDVKDNGSNTIWFTYVDELENYEPYNVQVPIRVTPIVIEKPTLTGDTEFTYDGEEHSVTVKGINEELMEVENLSHTHAGKYQVRISLKEWQNYAWAGEDQNTQHLYLDWRIQEKELTFINNDEDYAFTWDEVEQIKQGTYTGTLPFTTDFDLVNIAVSNTNDSVTFKITLKIWDEYIAALAEYSELLDTDPEAKLQFDKPVNYTYPDVDTTTIDSEDLLEMKSYCIYVTYEAGEFRTP